MRMTSIQVVEPSFQASRPLSHKVGEKVTRVFFSTASLVAGILVAVLIQAVLSSVWDSF